VAVILPETAAPGLWAVDRAHRYVLERIAAAIERAGAPAAVRGHGDLVIGERKCGGSAQRRLKQWFMVHCSILLEFAIERIDRYLAIPGRQPDYRRGRAHQDFLCNLKLPRVVVDDAIRDAFTPGSGIRPARALPMDLVKSLVAEKISNPSWVERF
jgi:lipoate-protein ligase A